MAPSHQCNRDDCPPANVNGPKLKCSKCGKLCFLKCFGIQQSFTVESTESIKIKLPTGGTVFAFLPHSAFVCCTDEISLTDLKKQMKLPKPPRSTSKNRQSLDSVDYNSVLTELASIKEIVSVTKSNTESLLENEKKQQNRIEHTKTVPYPPFTHSPAQSRLSKPSYADTMKNFSTPSQALKRKRQDTPKQPNKLDVPPPKLGTKVNSGGLAVAPEKIKLNQKFEKAIWISRLNPSVSIDDITNYITANTSITDTSRFKIFKLVKKDRDLSTLNFVSFKIELNTEDFDILVDPDVWSKGVMVREFLQNRTLGDFLFPALNERQNPKTSTVESMETNQPQPVSSKQISPKQSVRKQTTPKKSPPKASFQNQ